MYCCPKPKSIHINIAKRERKRTPMSIETPDKRTSVENSQSEPTPIVESNEQSPRVDRKVSLRNKLIAGAAGVALVAGGVGVGVNVAANQPPSSEPIPTEPSEPTPENPVAHIPELQFTPEPIDAEVYKDAQSVVDAYLIQKNNWINDGSTRNNADAWINGGEGPEFFDQLLSTSDKDYIDTLVIENYEANTDDLPVLIDRIKEIHSSTVVLNFLTTPGIENAHPEDKEAYVRAGHAKIIRVISETEAEISAVVLFDSTDNSEQNRTDALTGGSLENIPVTPFAISWSNIDGHWVVSGVDFSITQ